jgi:probable F420-dependent oxidoreductase
LALRYLLQHPEPVGTGSDLLRSEDVTVVARALEAAGWDGLAFTEHPAPSYRWLAEGSGHQTLDPFVALGAAAVVTERITLLTYVAVLPYRNPFLTAKAAATVDVLSRGRFVLGVGTGYLKSEFHALGVAFDDRNDLFDEAMEAMRLHWSGERFDFEGAGFSARDLIARPAPTRQIPIWIGGNAKLTRWRVAAKAQGWMPMTGAAGLARTTRTAQLATLDDVAAAIQGVKDDAGDRAAELDFLVLYTDESILEPGRDVERHRDELGRIRDAGATWVSFSFDIPDQRRTIEFIEAFAADHLGVRRV